VGAERQAALGGLAALDAAAQVIEKALVELGECHRWAVAYFLLK